MSGPESESEFDLIRRYFSEPVVDAASVRLGIGDDAALLAPAPGQELVVSVDTLVEGTHFFPDHPPVSLGHKALAANLSDLAAMGAVPLGSVLSLTLPRVDHAWLTDFSKGFFALARKAGVALVGGDTNRGPCSISVTVLGQVPAGQALRRAGARPGDRLVVSGSLGGAAAGLAREYRRREQGGRKQGGAAPNPADPSRARLFWPQARLELGRALRNRAHAAIDISDGLLADLGHLCAASGCGARVDATALPRDPLLDGLDEATMREYVLGGGEDYELLFACPPDVSLEHVRQDLLKRDATVALTVIGEFTLDPSMIVVDAQGRRMDTGRAGHDHFAGPA